MVCSVFAKSVSAQTEPNLATPLFGSHTPFFLQTQPHVTMVHLSLQPTPSATELARTMSDKDREGSLLRRWFTAAEKLWWIDLAYTLLQSLPRSRLAWLRDRINPLLEFDILGVRFFTLAETFASR